eukprot:SAG22_NODE_9655_length_576_cov_2.368973_1_plen_86_part_00
MQQHKSCRCLTMTTTVFPSSFASKPPSRGGGGGGGGGSRPQDIRPAQQPAKKVRFVGGWRMEGGGILKFTNKIYILNKNKSDDDY